MGVEINASPDTVQVISEAVFTANHLTDADKQNRVHKLNTTQNANDAKYSETKLPGFSCFLQHSASEQDGLILQCSRAHTHADIHAQMHRYHITSDKFISQVLLLLQRRMATLQS